MKVVLAQQVHGNEDKVHVSKHQGPFLRIALPALDERDWVVSPMAAGVQVVRCVVAVVEGEAITLIPLVVKTE